MTPLHRVLRGVGGLGLALVAPIQISVVMAAASIEGRVTILDRQGKSKTQHDGVVIFLDALEHPPAVSPPQQHATMRQINKRFEPEVLPILVGTTVDFPNSDTIYHNVFSLSKIKPFDLGIYEQGASKSVTFTQPGLVKVYCNIHPQMIACILVLSNPYFTMTDQQGRFVLPDVPLGAVTVRSWYPRSHQQPERKVIVAAQGIQDLNLSVVESLRFEIREETISPQHKNKWGQDYPAKY